MMNKISWYLNKIKQVGGRVFTHFWRTQGFVNAESLAFTTLLSIVPLMVLSLGIFSYFPAFNLYLNKAHEFLFQHFVPASANKIAGSVTALAEVGAKHSFTGLIFSLITSLILIFSLESAFNLIWQVKSRRPFFSALFMYGAALILLPALTGMAFALDVVLDFIPILDFVPVFVIWITFFILYKIIPNTRVNTTHAAIGALVSALLFEILKILFGFYISYFSSFKLIYGALAVIPIFLTWLFLAWLVVLLGAVLAYVLSLRE